MPDDEMRRSSSMKRMMSYGLIQKEATEGSSGDGLPRIQCLCTDTSNLSYDAGAFQGGLERRAYHLILDQFPCTPQRGDPV